MNRKLLVVEKPITLFGDILFQAKPFANDTVEFSRAGCGGTGGSGCGGSGSGGSGALVSNQ